MTRRWPVTKHSSQCRLRDEDSSTNLDGRDVSATDGVIGKRAADSQDCCRLLDGERESLVNGGCRPNARSARGSAGLVNGVGCTDVQRLCQLGGTR